MPKQPIDPRDVFLAGTNFELASILLAEYDRKQFAAIHDRRKKQGFCNDLVMLMNFPQTVNAAFALELYFKTLIYVESVTPTVDPIREHRLLPLFNLISIPRQKRIRELFDQLTEHHPWWIRTKTSFPSEFVDLQLLKALENASNAFREHRYYFEGIESAKRIAFGPAVPATRMLILEINPEWRKFLKTVLPTGLDQSSLSSPAGDQRTGGGAATWNSVPPEANIGSE
ncbi:MAG TPA: hypothetical protein VFV87_05985 [Pirellulaceae bacterium]|nr:hypothetical protein [Pirellulaceae bacterium]